jgi:PAS domain S-box-containing protein
MRMFSSCAEIIKPGVKYEDILRGFIKMGGQISGFASADEWVDERLRVFRIADGRNIEQNLNGRWTRVSDHRTHDGGVVSLRTDVTSLKEIQENLELRTRALAAVNNGVLVTDPSLPDNPIVDVNPAFERITGYTKAEIIGKNCRILQGSDTDQDVRKLMRESIKTGGDCQVTIKNYRKDGTPFWNDVTITPIRDARGNLTHFVGVVTDVTARVEAEHVRQRAAEELRRSNEELERFAYVASHDLQEPLRMVASYTQLLARRYKDKLDDSGREFIEFAVDGAKRMQEFIQDLLKYSRVGTQGRPFQDVEMNRVMERVIANLRFAIEEKKAEVAVADLPVLWGDPVQLAQVFQNLIGNALKFCSTGRPLKIEIGASQVEDFWEFTVRDNGIGIDPEDTERIFVIFQRLHTRQEYEGTGIGLAICKKIVERHGGRIWVDSIKGEGSTFHLTIKQKHEESPGGGSA